MNSSIRDRRLNSSSNQNEKSFRKKNPKTNNSCINNNVNNCNKNDNTHANGNYNENNFINNENEKKVSDDNSNFKNELKSFLQENNNFDKINKNDLVELEKQKIIEINEEEDERSIDMNVGINSNIYYMNNNPDANNNLNTNSINTNYANREESIKNYKKSLSSTNKNPLEKFENLYLKGKSESNSNKDNNKYSKKSENVNYSVKTGDEILAKKENEIISTKNNNIKQEQTADFLSKDIKDLNIAYGLEHEENEENEELLDLNNFEENGEIEEIFNLSDFFNLISNTYIFCLNISETSLSIGETILLAENPQPVQSLQQQTEAFLFLLRRLLYTSQFSLKPHAFQPSLLPPHHQKHPQISKKFVPLNHTLEYHSDK